MITMILGGLGMFDVCWVGLGCFFDTKHTFEIFPDLQKYMILYRLI